MDEIALEYPGRTLKTEHPETYRVAVALDSISGFARSEFRTLPEKAIYSAQDAFRAVPGLREIEKVLPSTPAATCYCRSLSAGRCDFCTGLRVPPSTPAAPPAPVPPPSSDLPTSEDAAAPASTPDVEEILAEAGDLLDALDSFEKGGEG